MLQNSFDNLRLLCYDADVPKKDLLHWREQNPAGAATPARKKGCFGKDHGRARAGGTGRDRVCDLGPNLPARKSGDKLRALELIYKYLGLGDGAAVEEPVVIVDEAPTEQEVTHEGAHPGCGSAGVLAGAPRHCPRHSSGTGGQGGRGSGKSSYISIELVLQLLRHPACHAVVLRKIGGTLRTSVYAQIQWAIGALGLAKQFRCTVSPMECTYLPQGRTILFLAPTTPAS